MNANPNTAAGWAIATKHGAKRVREASPEQRAYLASYGFDADELAKDLDRKAALLQVAFVDD